MTKSQQEYWNKFLLQKGLPINTPCYEAFAFNGGSEEVSKWLLDLVLQGKKRATTSGYRMYFVEFDKIAKVGDLSLVLDLEDNPKCVIQTTRVLVKKIKDMTFDEVKKEGEDECLETWYDGHKRLFSEEYAEEGLNFSDDDYVVFEDFDVIYE